MDHSRDLPDAGKDSTATAAVAELMASLTLPSLESLDADIQGITDLPSFPLPASPNQTLSEPKGNTAAPESQLDMARQLMDNCFAAIRALKKHQNQCTALAAVHLERLHSSVALEGGILAFDRWQLRNSLSSMEAELAMIMHIPEGSANRLMGHATILVRELPTTMEQLQGGELGWEHAVIIAEEIELLNSSGVGATD